MAYNFKPSLFGPLIDFCVFTFLIFDIPPVKKDFIGVSVADFELDSARCVYPKNDFALVHVVIIRSHVSQFVLGGWLVG